MDKEWQSQPISDTIKSEVAADLFAGLKPADIAEKHQISLSSITRIKQKFLSPEMLAHMENERMTAMQDLMMMSLEASVEGTIRIANQTQDKAWLFAQDAGDLGKMYGIMSDKIIRTCQALERTEQPTQESGSDLAS